MGTPLPTVQDMSPDLAREGLLSGLKGKISSLRAKGEAVGANEEQRFRAELKEAAEGFEAMMLRQLFKEMLPEDQSSLFGEGLGSKTYHSLFIDELSTLAAKTGQLGLAETIEREVAAQAGLTDESENRTEPIPGTALGRPLPQPLRRSTISYSDVTGTNGGTYSNDYALEQYARDAVNISFVEPLHGRQTSKFGERNDPFTNSMSHHRGLDIAAAEGSEIKAAATGKVTFSGWKSGYGNIVIIEHAGGYETRYAHNADNLVREGETVTAGQVVAKVGSTGRSTGPHLHFELRKDGLPRNPEEVLSRVD